MPVSPWYVIPSDDKRRARLRLLAFVAAAIVKNLGEPRERHEGDGVLGEPRVHETSTIALMSPALSCAQTGRSEVTRSRLVRWVASASSGTCPASIEAITCSKSARKAFRLPISIISRL